MSFTQQIGNPNATYPPSLTLAQSANGVGLVSIGSDVKYVTFNPIPSYSWIPLSTNPYENYFFAWYTGTDFGGDYYEGFTPDFATFNALNVRSLELYFEPVLSGIANLNQYPNLDTIYISNVEQSLLSGINVINTPNLRFLSCDNTVDNNTIKFLYTLPPNINHIDLYGCESISTNTWVEVLSTLAEFTSLTGLSFQCPTLINQTFNSFRNLQYLRVGNIDTLTTITLKNLSALQTASIINNTLLSDITLENTAQLRDLQIIDCGIKDGIIENLPELRNLSFQQSQISSLTLTNLPQLDTLNVAMTQLSSLTLENLPITDYTTVGVPLVSFTLRQLPNITYAFYNIFGGGNIKDVTLQDLPSVDNITFSNNKISAISIQNVPILDTLDIRNNLLSSLSITYAALSTQTYPRIILTDNPLSYIDMTGLSARGVVCTGSNLPLSAVNHIAVQCDLGGILNGGLYLDDGTNSPLSGVGITAKDNLLAKGWTVVSNT